MTEVMTQTQAETAVSLANNFMDRARGELLDGAFASRQLADRVIPIGQLAEAVLTAIPYPARAGWYAPLSKYNAGDYNRIAAVLPGYMVLVPASLTERGVSSFYPAVVSEDGLKASALRLHVLRQAYRQQLSYGASVVLSAAGQSETAGVGEHGRKAVDGIEAEHFATLLAVSNDEHLRTAWQSGRHVNHVWRGDPGNSVTSEVSSRLFAGKIPQTTITITKRQIETGRAMVLWHEGMRDQATGRPETAIHDNALVVMQALGYEALRGQNPGAVETVKSIIA